MEESTSAIVDKDNQLALRDLTRQVRSPLGIIPFIGAGMSFPVGFPLWTGFLLESAKKIGAEKEAKEHTDGGRYEEAAQLLEDRLGERGFHDLIRDWFGEHRMKEDGLKGVVALLPSIAPGPVVTTNFDRVLERVFERAGREFETRVKGAEIDTLGEVLDLNRHVLLKVHGDVEDRTHRILTSREYERSYGARDCDTEHLLSKQLELLALRGKFLFLGCSLQEDRLMEVLARINKAYQNVVHNALLQKPPDPAAFGKRVKFLSDRGIRPIWYPENQFENIRVFLSFLAKQRSSPAASRMGEEIADREQAIVTRSSHLLVGRESVLALLDTYASSPGGAIQVVTGDAGMGKTALLARWVSQQASRSSRTAYHFFSERNRLTSARDSYLHLLYQLADSNLPAQVKIWRARAKKSSDRNCTAASNRSRREKGLG